VNTVEFAPPRSLTGLLLAAVAMVSVASGLIHFAAVPEHWASYRIAAVFFVGRPLPPRVNNPATGVVRETRPVVSSPSDALDGGKQTG